MPVVNDIVTVNGTKSSVIQLVVALAMPEPRTFSFMSSIVMGKVPSKYMEPLAFPVMITGLVILVPADGVSRMNVASELVDESILESGVASGVEPGVAGGFLLQAVKITALRRIGKKSFFIN